MNSVNIMGNLGKDPELRHTQTGKAVCTFDLAVAGYNETTWLAVVSWDKTAELVCKYAQKGSKLGVSGRLQVREWVDRDNNKRRSVEIVATSVHFAGKNDEGGNAAADVANNATTTDAPRTATKPPDISADDFEVIEVANGELPF